MSWIKTDIPCINVTHIRYNALTPAIVYVGNDVHHPIRPQDITIATQKTLLQAHVNGI